MLAAATGRQSELFEVWSGERNPPWRFGPAAARRAAFAPLMITPEAALMVSRDLDRYGQKCTSIPAAGLKLSSGVASDRSGCSPPLCSRALTSRQNGLWRGA
jgi:hypothetical protein